MFRNVELVIDWGDDGDVGEFLGYRLYGKFGKLLSGNEFDDRVF